MILNRIQKLCVLFILSLFFNVNVFADPCITAVWTASCDANVGCQPTENGKFAEVNGVPVYFKHIPDSTVTYNNKQTSSKARGCFSQSALNVGTNSINISFVYANTSTVTGTATATFTLDGRAGNLCQA